ncbi:MAG: hypothetical protein A2504_01010 [Bdellovibrionales bacterium RIFOXYD12_FULL_39_22]|nr:MAG: hypothetical protein A2385_03630 [Bdellovibrionales bacterium RIFOXYB1_FULL_39_21]OFZ42581.1 MAG: hypothetical protein A2485_09675 [Bdellovibrionales bacterium RIFOXYC12_FULL_39_17]OFZ47151.1 MAG: hypothetical protein A2404_15620 [Bdellovibrionales bacterium RIFOXYC1_FULL_39_130]OFZ75399.1 MAG: hypothetical protein A2560_14395 [Bdellovibrionales bacterium RIFOXYD1_FULL_39_84]OFZ93350.1 MAG: hypothetical protein A2504_01010 [Bdellovibrionales bacterium RIFOXYD12_FULL_39_22]HLE09974.1 pu
MDPTPLQIIGTTLFAIAVLHTFVVNYFQKLAHKYPEGSIMENIFHFLGEVEAVFGMWAVVFLGFYTFYEGFMVTDEAHNLIGGAVHYINSQNYTEPAFVFVIMCMAGTRPIIFLAGRAIFFVAKILPVPPRMAFYISTLILGPLLGSFITEPAAMTVTALILLENFYEKNMSSKFKYATIGALFVNVSIGGTLSHFAAPPVLMVAGKWHWGMAHMFGNFGYKAAVSVMVTTVLTAIAFRKELAGEFISKKADSGQMTPTWWIILVHVLFLVMVVYTVHYMSFFLGLFLFFLGFTKITSEYQDKMKIRDSLMVGFFLGGLVTLGSMQSWWLQIVLTQMGDFVLFLGATALTAITDNAALTYLGSLVELTDSAKFNLVAGAVAGGGLTVIANAPNPAGYGILKGSFGKEGIHPGKLFLGAFIPTIIDMICLQVLPHIHF